MERDGENDVEMVGGILLIRKVFVTRRLYTVFSSDVSYVLVRFVSDVTALPTGLVSYYFLSAISSLLKQTVLNLRKP